MEFVHQAVGLIATHKTWAGLAIAALSFGESMVVLGLLVPGTAVLIVIGGFIGAGERGYFAAAPESCAVTTRAVGVVGLVAAIRLGLGVARHRFGQHSGQGD